MPKQPSKIRWREVDEETLRRTVNNFNAKIYRIRRKNPVYDDFPDYTENYLPKPILKADYEDLKKKIYSRNDFNKLVNRYQRFTKPGAEEPVKTERSGKTTKWFENELSIGNRTANQIKANDLKRLGDQPLTSSGVPQGGTRKQQGDIWREELKPRDMNIKNKSSKELEKALEDIDSIIFDAERLLGLSSYRDNYLSTMEDMGYPDDLISLVESIPLDVFYDTTKLDTDANIEFLYWEDYNEYVWKCARLRNLWGSVKAKLK